MCIQAGALASQTDLGISAVLLVDASDGTMLCNYHCCRKPIRQAETAPICPNCGTQNPHFKLEKFKELYGMAPEKKARQCIEANHNLPDGHRSDLGGWCRFDGKPLR